MVEERTTGTFNATGPTQPLAMRAMLAAIADGVRADARPTWLPTAFLEAEKVSPWSDLPVWVPGEGESAGFARRSIARALAAGLTFRPLATTAAETLAWFRAQPPARQAKLRAGLSAEREAELLARWHAAAASSPRR